VNTQVKTVNGADVDCLKDLVTKVENCKKEFLEFGLEYNQVHLLLT
jgi:PDZ domain